MNCGDETMPQTQSVIEQQPDQAVAKGYKMRIQQTTQTPEMV